MDIEPRKSPRQRRARETVDAILRATEQVLASDGYARASTNRIAEVAGVSVGSLYQYFPNKDALISAVTEEHTRAMRDLLIDTAMRYRDAPLADGVRYFVRGMIAAHTIDPALHRALVQQLLQLGLEPLRAAQTEARTLVAAWLGTRAELRLADPAITAFVLVAAVESVIHAALFEEPELLARPAFEDELVQLVLRHLGVS